MEPFSHHQKSQKPIAFSFGQENNSQEIFVQDNYLIGNRAKTKYQFIKQLIQKYDQKPKRILEKTYQSGSKLREESSGKKVNSAEKAALPPKPHRPQKQKKEEQAPSKEKNVGSNSSNSEIKAELEKSHQELLERFKSPLQNDSKTMKKKQEKEMKSENLNKQHDDRIGEQQKEKSAISTQNSNSSGSIPLIESVLMSNQQSARSSRGNQKMKESPVRELSEFLIPEGEVGTGQEQAKEAQGMKLEEKNVEEKEQNEQKENVKVQGKEDDDEKMTIFWLCFIVLLIVLLFYPTDWEQNMNGF